LFTVGDFPLPLEISRFFGLNGMMNAEQKTVLARFLDAAGDYLRDGYALPREYRFADDPEAPGGEPSLPLAYLVDEADPEAGDSLDSLGASIRACKGCPLWETRTQGVPGEGAAEPLVLVVGEGPGAEEDRSGRPFVGKAGQLLDRMLASICLYREENCFIANVVKCRPPGNRDPLPGETAACASFLARQIALLKPLAILALGRVAAQALLGSDEGIGKLRGRFFEYPAPGGIPLLPSYHPSALLRDESLKGAAWKDLQLLGSRLAEADPLYGALYRKKLADLSRRKIPGEGI
jgi:DNA polymerase